MYRFRFITHGLWADRNLVPWVTLIIIMLNVSLGTAVVIGGPKRFQAPSYSALVDLSHNHVWIWGVMIIISGVFMSTPFRNLNIAGLWIGVVFYMTWMSAFTVAAFEFKHAATTPIPVYAALALICTALLTGRVIDKDEEQRKWTQTSKLLS